MNGQSLNTKYCWGCESTGTQSIYWLTGGMQNGIATSGNSLADSYKSGKKNKTFYHMILQLCFLVFIQMNWKHVHTKICTWLFVAALFIIAKTWKWPTHPSVQEWINKLWYIQTIEYYSMLNRKELSSHVKTWKNLKCLLPSERRQSDKATYSMIPTVWHSRKKL